MELKPVVESTSDYEKIEERIKRVFLEYFYAPILKEFEISKDKIMNSLEDLNQAISAGKITYSRGSFRGKFDAKTSRTLKRMGGKWVASSGSFKLPAAELSPEIRASILTSESSYKTRIKKVDKRISQIKPEDIAKKIKTKDLFVEAMVKTDKEIKKSVRDLTVYPELSAGEREKIATEWQNNMDLWIKDFTEKEIISLRKDIQLSTFAGNRHESITKSIQRSYGVTANKAKFLARQETSLLMAKFKETRYTKLGINEYKWRCVVGSKNHPVRPAHKILDGKVFAWENPPITTESGQPTRRNNPGQDYNCRCMAIPIVNFRTA